MNDWSGGSPVAAGSTCTPIRDTGSGLSTPVVTQNLCFGPDPTRTPIFPCNITAPSFNTPGAAQITLTSHFITASGSKQPNPAYFMCSDGINDCANIFTADPCLPTGCLVSGGTNRINSREIIGSGAPSPYSAFVQQPINADGSSVFSAKKGVIPVKFTLTKDGTATCQLPPATITLTRTAGGTIGPIDESVYMGSADSGSNFRISGCQYVYNLASPGPGTYEVDIITQNSLVGSAIFALK